MTTTRPVLELAACMALAAASAQAKVQEAPGIAFLKLRNALPAGQEAFAQDSIQKGHELLAALQDNDHDYLLPDPYGEGKGPVCIAWALFDIAARSGKAIDEGGYVLQDPGHRISNYLLASSGKRPCWSSDLPAVSHLAGARQYRLDVLGTFLTDEKDGAWAWAPCSGTNPDPTPQPLLPGGNRSLLFMAIPADPRIGMDQPHLFVMFEKHGTSTWSAALANGWDRARLDARLWIKGQATYLAEPGGRWWVRWPARLLKASTQEPEGVSRPRVDDALALSYADLDRILPRRLRDPHAAALGHRAMVDHAEYLRVWRTWQEDHGYPLDAEGLPSTGDAKAQAWRQTVRTIGELAEDVLAQARTLEAGGLDHPQERTGHEKILGQDDVRKGIGERVDPAQVQRAALDYDMEQEGEDDWRDSPCQRALGWGEWYWAKARNSARAAMDRFWAWWSPAQDR